MRIIKYEGDENYLFILSQEEEQYFLIYGKIKDLSLTFDSSTDAEFIPYLNTSLNVNKRCNLEMSFEMNKNKFVTIQTISSPKEYEVIVSVVKNLL